MARSPSSSPATAFANALRSFETGGLTFRDVLDEVAILLENGASPQLLLETLERRAAIEPLSESAYVEVSGIIHEAIERRLSEASLAAEPQIIDADIVSDQDANSFAEPDAVGSPAAVLVPSRSPGPWHGGVAAPARMPPSEVELAAVARATMLAADLAVTRAALESEQHRIRDINTVLAEKIASAEAARARAEETTRESERSQTEARLLRQSLDARDASLAEVTYALGQRDTQLTALQREHAKTVPALETRVVALTADLAASRAALESEQTKARESYKTLSAQVGSAEAVRSRTEEALRESEHFQGEARTLQASLAAREAEYAALRREQADMARSLEARARVDAQLETDLQAAREHATALAGELGAVRTELELERRRVQEVQKALADATATGRSRAEAAAREAEHRRNEARVLRDSLGGARGRIRIAPAGTCQIGTRH